MTFEELKALDEQYVLQTYGRNPIAIDHGRGATLYDLDGREYIDFTAGIGVNSVGTANPRWQAAIAEQAAKLGHISNLFYTQPYALLAEKLCPAPAWRRPSSATPAPRPTRAPSRRPASTASTTTARAAIPSSRW